MTGGIMYDLKQWIEMQQALMQTLKPYMEMLGLELYVDRIVLKPKDCPDTCVDYVWRIKCKDVEICENLRSVIKSQGGGVNVG
jgi:hypothetical protein